LQGVWIFTSHLACSPYYICPIVPVSLSDTIFTFVHVIHLPNPRTNGQAKSKYSDEI
jgi:hypothetical protein